jgi:hypothetical protein
MVTVGGDSRGRRAGRTARQSLKARDVRKEKPMNRLGNPICLTLITLAATWVAAPSFAQQPVKDLVPFKCSWTVQNQPTVVATDPAIVSLPSTATGQSDLFGAFSGVAVATQRLGVDGRPLYVTVVGEWTMANGDAISLEVLDVFLPPTAPGGPGVVGAVIITNGKGRFLGARGSGFVRGTLQKDPVTGAETVILTAEGLITRPK